MAHAITVLADNVIVGGAEHDTGDELTVSDAEYDALTAAGAFEDLLDDDGEVQDDDSDDLYADASLPTAMIALTSAAATGGEAPTEAEYNALRTDLVNTRTYLTGVVTSLTGAGKPYGA